MHTILWRDLRTGGVERAVLAIDPAGFHLAGTALLAVDGAPVEIRYSVLTDTSWHTRVVGVHLQGADVNRRLALRSDGAGRWTSGDEPQPELDGALDVDLTFTPATNTLPIRRLALEPGSEADVAVARLDPVGRETALVTHRYSRVAKDRYRYASGDFTTDLVVDDQGLVLDYPGHFETIARSEVASTG